MTEYALVKWICMTSVFMTLLTGMALIFYFSYYYLRKFEREQHLTYKGYRTLYHRSKCLGALSWLSMATPNTKWYIWISSCVTQMNCEYYLNIPREKLKNFKISFWIGVVGVFSGLLTLLIMQIYGKDIFLY